MPELTQTEHRTRTRLLWTAAIVVALGLGALAIFGVDLAPHNKRTDVPFWQQVWNDAKESFQNSKSTKKSNTNQEIQQLGEKVFPQLETKN